MSNNTRRVVAIIQARLGSSRLPGKTLKVLFGKPLLQHIIERVRGARFFHEIVVATSEGAGDDRIAEFGQTFSVPVFRGSEDDVLARFHGAAVAHKAEVIVRVTADRPFEDPEIIDHAISLLLKNEWDYCSNTIRPTYPEGLDIEVFSSAALDRAFREAKLPSEKEHVTPYIWKNPDKFRLHNFTHSEDLSQMRWTIDYENDFRFAEEVYRRLYPKKPLFLMKDILELLRNEPSLATINAGTVRNEGYQKSLMKESQQ